MMSGVVRETLSVQTAKILREKILCGALKSGDRIWADDLAAEFGVSLAPVKEALLVLHHEGLVVNVPRRGTIIRTFTRKEVKQLYDVRSIVEVNALHLSMKLGNITPDRLDDLRRTNEAIGNLVESGSFPDPMKAYSFDLEFHRLLVEGCGNDYLIQWYEHLQDHAQIVRIMSFNELAHRGSATYDEHAVILDALYRQDQEGVAEGIQAHLGQILSAISPIFEKLNDELSMPSEKRSAAR